MNFPKFFKNRKNLEAFPKPASKLEPKLYVLGNAPFSIKERAIFPGRPVPICPIHTILLAL
jgi:hypothetical protein